MYIGEVTERPFCVRCKDNMHPGIITVYNKEMTDKIGYRKCGCRYTPDEMNIPDYVWNNDLRPMYAEVPQDVRDTIDEYIESVKPYNADPSVAKIVHKVGLLLTSVQGAGKTYLTAYVLQKLAYTKGIKCHYITVYDLVELGRSWDDYDSEKVEFVERVEMLALDDIAAIKMTNWSDAFLTKLIDYRYRRGLPMILASDRSLDDLESHMFVSEHTARRICSRLRECCVLLELPNISYRFG
jgi:chromosomal replication initiation ATPase DnaA